jgi:hypothetical protein
MAGLNELLRRAQANPSSLRFAEACQLAEGAGFELARQRGSHRVYKRPGLLRLLNLQPARNGMAKAYQVRQLLVAIDELQSG